VPLLARNSPPEPQSAVSAPANAEMEWEYAARAGVTRSRYGDLNAVAWNSDNSGRMTHPVAQKQANAFGLFDMLGNVGSINRGSGFHRCPRFRYDLQKALR
jgi:Sulfatase-modifying factor enzyme 1